MLLELSAIEKRFGGVHALKRGDLKVDAGEVHALVGENGAGKSTLMKIVAGMLERDGGSMLWKGEEVHLRRPAEAGAMGISMVHQESLLAPHLTVAENVFLGHERLNGPILDQRAMEQETARLIQEHRFPLRADWRVERLSPAQKQLVEIVRALHGESSLIIFDEPTSSLSDAEAAEVFRIVKQLRGRGVAILYSLMIGLSATSIWLGQNRSLYDFWFYITNFSRYPMEIYSGRVGTPLQWFCTFIIPVLIVVNVPARIIARPVDPQGYTVWPLALFALVATAGSLAVSRWVFLASLRSYRSASS